MEIMRFYTKDECEQWLRDTDRQKPDRIADNQRQRFNYPTLPQRIFHIARWIAQNLTYRQPTLLWITEWGIWPSSENWHLYYRLRQSYGDLRLLPEAPGHLFLEHEAEDLASFTESRC